MLLNDSRAGGVDYSAISFAAKIYVLASVDIVKVCVCLEAEIISSFCYGDLSIRLPWASPRSYELFAIQLLSIAVICI